MSDDVERFWSKVMPEPMSGCWLWGASTVASGYGQLTVQRRHRWAHRVAWELERGSVPEQHEVHHVCRNRACVNPDHLQVLTRSEHSRETIRMNGPTGVAAVAASKSTCPRFHEYDEYRSGQRVCSTCRKAANRRYQRKLREGAA